MSARKPERAMRETCRSLTIEELEAADKELSKAINVTSSKRRAVRRELRRRRSERATSLLAAHIEASRAEVRKITLHKLFEARRGSRGCGCRRICP